MISRVQQELERRAKNRRIVDKIIATSWPEQLRIVDYKGDKRKLAIHGTRRSSKSSGIAIRFLKRALLQPGYKAVFISMTFRNVDRDFYTECIKEFLLNAGYRGDLPAHLPIKFKNGSAIHGFAADSADDAKKKLRGSHWDDVALDEAQSWKTDIEDFDLSVISPTLLDKSGNFFLLGTPGDVKGTYWHKIVTPGTFESIEYDVEMVHVKNNPYMNAQYFEMVERLKQNNPERLLTPKHRREWEGIWEVEDDMHVYRLGKSNLQFKELPGTLSDFVFSFGVDAGWNDEFAISVNCWPKKGKNTFFIVEIFKQSFLDPIECSEKIVELNDKYNPYRITVDTSAPALIALLNNRFHINCSKSESRGKEEHIDFFNADMKWGNIQILPQPASILVPEWAELIYDRKSLEEKLEKVHKGKDHASDATLYGYWAARHYWTKPEPDRSIVIDHLSPEYQFQRMEKALNNPKRSEINELQRRINPSNSILSQFRNLRNT